MTVAVGILLGAGLLLVASPWLWPARPTERHRRAPLDGLRSRLHDAGFEHVSAATVIALAVLLGIAVAAVSLLLIPIPVVGFGAGAAAAWAPIAVISSRARARRRATRGVWPDVIDHLVAGLRAGLPLPEALCALAETGPSATRAAFAAFEREHRASGRLGPPLDSLKDRLADPVADRLIETLRMAREVGGAELPGVLRSLAGYVRADAAARAEVEARQSWIVVAARLGVAAPWIVLLLLTSRPEAVEAYQTPAGATLLAVGLVVTAVAYRVMLAIGRLPEERRWFA